MKRSLLLAVATLILTAGTPAQAVKEPTFRQYSAAIERPRVKAINFRRNPDARSFRTRLSAAVRSGVNFSGHYIVAGWGCGTGCVSGAIIDTRTGDVYWPKQFNAIGVWYDGENYAAKPIEYRRNSRLMIINGSPGNKNVDSPDLPSGRYFYKWSNNRFSLIRFVKLKAD